MTQVSELGYAKPTFWAKDTDRAWRLSPSLLPSFAIRGRAAGVRSRPARRSCPMMKSLLFCQKLPIGDRIQASQFRYRENRRLPGGGLGAAEFAVPRVLVGLHFGGVVAAGIDPDAGAQSIGQHALSSTQRLFSEWIGWHAFFGIKPSQRKRAPLLVLEHGHLTPVVGTLSSLLLSPL